MKLSEKCSCVCKSLENLLLGLDVTYEKVFPCVDDARCNDVLYKIKNGPVFSDYFTRSDLSSLVSFCIRYSRIEFFINTMKKEVIFFIFIPFDL